MAVALFAHVRDAEAQSISGRATLPDGATAAVGAIIEAILVGDPAIRARALTGSRGDFLLQLPLPGRYRLAGLRVGYRPTAFETIDVAAGDVHEARYVLGRGAFAIEAVHVDSTSLCGQAADSAALVGSLLQQGRVALESSLLTSPDGAAEATWQQFSILTDRLGTPLTSLRIASHVGATDRPFRSIDLEELQRDGYYVARAEQIEFRAPDAEVLLSDWFVGLHCFRLSASHPVHEEWVGVAFESATARRAKVDISGTLWFDRVSAELRQAEFVYVGLPPGFDAVGARGTIDFMRLPTGIWLVRAWELRVPRLGGTRTRASREIWSESEKVSAMRVTGGEVTTVTLAGAELYRTTSHPTDRLPDIAARIGLAPSCGDEADATGGESGVLYGTVVNAMGTPVGNMDVQLEWIAGRKMSGRVPAFDGFFIACDVPIGGVVRLTAFRGTVRASAVMATRLTAGQPWRAVELVVW
jgi:hypothetical protein